MPHIHAFLNSNSKDSFDPALQSGAVHDGDFQARGLTSEFRKYNRQIAWQTLVRAHATQGWTGDLGDLTGMGFNGSLKEQKKRRRGRRRLLPLDAISLSSPARRCIRHPTTTGRGGGREGGREAPLLMGLSARARNRESGEVQQRRSFHSRSVPSRVELRALSQRRR